ncbi:unnamed protein product [Dibothriocephalus latus]|uniref:Uncharacterized protein n=1 Tax=Dibothriocephalus latus TaxID=60516 RepID=A0A3P7NLR6_DIBLA|nr:unnamed protein product [Dibothriocephalus latus]
MNPTLHRVKSHSWNALTLTDPTNPTEAPVKEEGEPVEKPSLVSPTPSEANPPPKPAIVVPKIDITPPDAAPETVSKDDACSPFGENTLFIFMKSQGSQVNISDFHSTGSIASVCVDADRAAEMAENEELHRDLDHPKTQPGEKDCEFTFHHFYQNGYR